MASAPSRDPDGSPERYPDAVLDQIEQLFARRGQEHYGEKITQLEHALQCAALARREGAPPALVAAALLHDIGHLIEDAEDETGVIRHDRSGSAWLSRHFGPEVCDPVWMHVDAKRYLCAAEPGYFERLSPASVRSLEKQGGPMSGSEVESFRRRAGFEEGVRLRRWDDEGKVEGLDVGCFEDYRPLLLDLLRR